MDVTYDGHISARLGSTCRAAHSESFKKGPDMENEKRNFLIPVLLSRVIPTPIFSHSYYLVSLGLPVALLPLLL